jgi:hypothetical protein
MIQDLEVRRDYVEFSAGHSSVQDSEVSGGASASEDPAGAALGVGAKDATTATCGCSESESSFVDTRHWERGHRMLMVDAQ